MAAKFSDLVEYFEKIATEHIEIKHSAANKHFYRFELDEVLTGMCGPIKYPALILEGYEINYAESTSDNIRKRRSGAFILLDKVNDLKDFNRIHEVWDEMEVIGDDILVKMKADKESRLVPVLRDFNINECSGTLLSINELGQHGIRFTFNITSAQNGIVNIEKWQ
jgi:hypothetical protein